MTNKPIDITKQVKRAEFKAKLKAKFQKAKKWCSDNKEVVIAAVSVAIGAVGTGIKVMGKRHNLHMEERNKDLRCYDTSLGHYWELKRKLGNKDWTKINRRREKGESLGEILDDMGVLK